MGIFDFKKNKGDAIPLNEVNNKEKEKKSTSKSTFKTHYNNLKNNTLNNTDYRKYRLNDLTILNDYSNTDDWVEALAICDICIHENTFIEEANNLYTLINRKYWRDHSSTHLSDKDYNDWFNINVTIANQYIKYGNYDTLYWLAYTYFNARRKQRDIKKYIELIKKGIELDNSICILDYAYRLYNGLEGFIEIDKKKGKELILDTKKLGHKAIAYRFYIDINDNIEPSILIPEIQKYIDSLDDESDKPYHLLGLCYLKENNIENATESFEKGIEAGVQNAKYVLAQNILRQKITNYTKEQGIALLKEAYSYGLHQASTELGLYYYYANDENSSAEEGLTWLEKGTSYCVPQATYELAYIYLYNTIYKNITKGLKYLEYAMEDGLAIAYTEKAFLLLDTDILDEDIDEAERLLNIADAKGDGLAPYKIGLCYQNAIFGSSQDYEKAFECFERGASRDHIYSLEMAGHYCRLGYGGDSDDVKQKTISYLMRAIEKNSNYAIVELAYCYEMGWGVDRNFKKGFELLQQAANNNYPFANFRMAMYLEEGWIGEPDTSSAFEQYKIAAEAGLPEALYNIGRFYKYAVGDIPENPELAIEYLQKAAESKVPGALVDLALSYEEGYGSLEEDEEKSLQYMTEAAEQDYPYAQYKLGIYYFYGLIDEDLERAKYWFERSANLGYPYASLMLGDFYMYNAEEKEEPEYGKAFQYYQQAANSEVISEGLGICYEFGWGVEENESEAFKYYTLGAEKNVTAAKYRLGRCYKYGIGTSIDKTEAYRWFSDADQNGNIYATYETAMLLLSGEGVSLNESEGASMLLRAAENEYHIAQYELGNCYLIGKGVPEDQVQAMIWYQKAADNGNEDAQKITGKRERLRR